MEQQVDEPSAKALSLPPVPRPRSTVRGMATAVSPFQPVSQNVTGLGTWNLGRTKTAFHFLAHDWEKLTITFKDCPHSLTVNGSGSEVVDLQQVPKCPGIERSISDHNSAVAVPTHLLHQMTPESLMKYCREQEQLLFHDGQAQCAHNNSRNKLVVSIQNVACMEPCTKLLKCGHLCHLSCHEDCNSYICQEFVPRPFPDCHHITYSKCGEMATTISSPVKCQTLVQPRDPAGCGHPVSVPCHRSDQATYEELLDACTAPCQHPASCNHTCTGTCRTCHQGRFHVRCSFLCTRILECGHQCGSICCAPYGCPPCQRPCDIRCEHGTCPKKCGEPCDACLKPCTWECRHFKCTKLCSEECDRKLCLEPCNKFLPCGCPCIGYCGEPCPPLCRNCNKEQIRSILLTGKELEEFGEDERFIFLPFCKHTLEYTVLDQIMSLENDTGTAMRPKTCPLCRAGIWESRPFNQKIATTRMKILKAKRAFFGVDLEISEIQLECLYKLTVSNRRDGHEQCSFNAFRVYLLNSFFVKDEFLTMPLYFASQVLTLVKAYLNVEKTVGEFQKLLVESHKAYIVQRGHDLYLEYVNRLFSIVTARPLPLLFHEQLDFNRELLRFSDLFNLILHFHQARPSLDSDYMEALDVLEDPNAYTKRVRIEFHRRFRRHWMQFFCAEKHPVLATIIYEDKMKIKDLQINWGEDSDA